MYFFSSCYRIWMLYIFDTCSTEKALRYMSFTLCFLQLTTIEQVNGSEARFENVTGENR